MSEHLPQHVRRYMHFFESISPDGLAEIGQLFDDYALFVDPFNEAVGPAAIRRVFVHMFEQCEQPRFEVTEVVSSAEATYLRWLFRFGAAPTVIEGVSRVVFNGSGRVSEHIDYWDPARQLYETVPVLGALMRWLRHRLAASPR